MVCRGASGSLEYATSDLRLAFVRLSVLLLNLRRSLSGCVALNDELGRGRSGSGLVVKIKGKPMPVTTRGGP
jgi:hypothetical protein